MPPTHTHILIVDDDEPVRDMLKTLLQENGYLVQTAKNGRDALELLRHVVFDILLTDLSMPVMDGRELARALRDEGFVIPLIVMSSLGDLAAIAQPLGAAAYIQKPVDFASFISTLANVVRDTKEPRRLDRVFAQQSFLAGSFHRPNDQRAEVRTSRRP